MSSKDITLYFDIETNPIDDFATLAGLTTVHCLSIYNPFSKKMVTYSTDSIKQGLEQLDQAGYICGHNIIGFDLPALYNVYKWRPRSRVLDTLVTSRAMYSDIRTDDAKLKDFPRELNGSHSLKAWGWRLGVTKDNFGEEDGAFDTYSDEMRNYCERDVLVTYNLATRLKEDAPALTMLGIEHQFASIIRQQEMRGFAFDNDKALDLLQTLTVRRAELRDELQQVFPPTTEEMKTAAGWKVESDGESYEADTKVKLKKVLKEAGVKQSLANEAVRVGNKIKTIPFNPGSRDQIGKRLEALGWKPTIFTPDGRAKIDEGVLKSIKHPSAEKLLEYLMVVKRLGQLAEGTNGWMPSVVSGRIHGKVTTNGAVTGRCTHSLPNLAQVPAVRAPYGRECRELFKAGEGFDLVGVDASGLELRCLAHYLSSFDGGEYGRYLLEEDIHTVNQKAAGLDTRDQAKTFIYAFLYGAGDGKIGEIVGGSPQQGKALKKRFLSQLPALARLKKLVEEKAKKTGFLQGVDGRALPIRSEHSALNTLLQSCGAVIMKQALNRLNNQLCRLEWKWGKDFAFVANVHDEFQAEVTPLKSDAYGRFAVESIRQAGEDLKIQCPLDGEFKVGSNWAETH